MDLLSAWIIGFIVVNALFSLPVAYVASQKGRSATGFFFLSFFLSFLVGILVVLALPKKESLLQITSSTGKFAKSGTEDLVKCPYCAEWVKTEAKVCKHCGREIQEDILAMMQAEIRNTKAAENKLEENQKALDKERERKAKARKDFLLDKKTILFSIIAVVVIAAISSTLIIISNIEAAKIAAEKERKTSFDYVASECLDQSVFDSGNVVISEDGKTMKLLTTSAYEMDCVSKLLVGLPLGTKQYTELPSGWSGTEVYGDITVKFNPENEHINVQMVFQKQ